MPQPQTAIPTGNFLLLPNAIGIQPAVPQAISGVLTFTPTTQQQLVDFTPDKRFQRFILQGIFIDASQSAVAVSATFQATGHTLTVQGGTQAFLPVVSPCDINADKDPGSTVRSNLSILFGCAAAAATQVTVQLLNTPTSPAVWTA